MTLVLIILAAVYIFTYLKCVSLIVVFLNSFLPFFPFFFFLNQFLNKGGLQLVRPDDVEEGDIVKYLVPVVPGIESPILGVVVQHGNVRVLVLEGDVDVLVGGGVGLVGVVHLGTSRVAVGDVERATDDEGLPSAAFRVAGVPGLEALQGVGVQLADDDVARVLIGGIDGPQPVLVHHEVNVRVATPGVVVHVVVAGIIQAASLENGLCFQVKPDNYVALVFIEIDRAIVDHLTGARPWMRETVGGKIVSIHEICHGFIFADKAVVVVAVHVPDLGKQQKHVLENSGDPAEPFGHPPETELGAKSRARHPIRWKTMCLPPMPRNKPHFWTPNQPRNQLNSKVFLGVTWYFPRKQE